MRILVVGSGGREHALGWRFARDGHTVAACGGNPGWADLGEWFAASAEDVVPTWSPELVVIGPEDPLVSGLADRLRGMGVAVFGPGADGARLEASKSYSKAQMLAAGVPTAASGTFFDARSAVEYARSRFEIGVQVVVKASGNALGKGVVVCQDINETMDAVQMMMVDRHFGDAGDVVVVEDRLVGPEFSLLSVVSGREFVSLPVSQDYKRIGDGNTGPNTGGMGTYSPVAEVSNDWVCAAEETVVRPMVNHLADNGIDYRGMLFSGLMVQDGVPTCLEYNVRFGDPETQTLMRRLGAGLAELLLAAAKGHPLSPVKCESDAAVTVVVASAGYPESSTKGVPIVMSDLPDEVMVFHAGTAAVDGQLVTNGGRVLGVSATGATVNEARERAYAGVECVRFEGMQYRRDIAAGS